MLCHCSDLIIMQTLRELKGHTVTWDSLCCTNIRSHTLFPKRNSWHKYCVINAGHYNCCLWGSSIFYFLEVLHDNSLEYNLFKAQCLRVEDRVECWRVLADHLGSIPCAQDSRHLSKSVLGNWSFFAVSSGTGHWYYFYIHVGKTLIQMKIKQILLSNSNKIYSFKTLHERHQFYLWVMKRETCDEQ